MAAWHACQAALVKQRISILTFHYYSMKKAIFLLLSMMVLLPTWAEVQYPSADDSIAFVQADFQWHSLAKGAQVGMATLQLFGRPEVITIVRYPMRRWRTEMVHAPREASSTTDTLAIRAKAKAAVNGSYFNMRTFEPVTFFSCRHEIVGRQHASTIARSTGVVAIKGREVVFMRYDSLQTEYYRRHYNYALQCGPLLLLNGVEQDLAEVSFNTVNHPRTLIGTTTQGECMMVVVDGRLKEKAQGATMWELAAIARWLGMTNALNLDGGGSSTLWTQDEGTINYPCDNSQFDHEGLRRIPNIITIR